MAEKVLIPPDRRLIEIRNKDGRTVICSRGREHRPNQFQSPTIDCPFCLYHEEETTAELCRFPPEESGEKWLSRAFPNRQSILFTEGANLVDGENGDSKVRDPRGAGVVIVAGNSCEENFATLSTETWVCVFKSFAWIINDLRKDKRLNFLQIFANHGEKANASMRHPHFQGIATTMIPDKSMAEFDKARKFYEKGEKTLMATEHIGDARHYNRVVWETENFICIVPYMPIANYEMWIIPKIQHAHFEQSKKLFTELADITSIAFKKLAALFGGVLPDLNCGLKELPLRLYQKGESGFWRYYFTIWPVVNQGIDGFRNATGITVLTGTSEEMAEALRNALRFK